MGVANDTKEIDGIAFTTVQFPSMAGLGLMLRLLKLLGPAAGLLGDSDVDPENFDLGAAGPALTEALAAMDPEMAQKLIQDLLRQTKAWVPDALGNGRYVEFTTQAKVDEVFTGRLKTLFKVLGFVIKVNFSDPEAGGAPAAPPAPATP